MVYPDDSDSRKVYVVTIDFVLTLDHETIVVSQKVLKPPDEQFTPLRFKGFIVLRVRVARVLLLVVY